MHADFHVLECPCTTILLISDQTEILKSTVNALKDGEVVAVPTDTLYGLACLAQSSEAVKKVYDIKGRNGQKPLAICVGEVEEIYKYVGTTGV